MANQLQTTCENLRSVVAAWRLGRERRPIPPAFVGCISGLGGCRSKGLDDLIHPELEPREREGLLHVGRGGRIAPHRVVVLDAAPLSVHHNLGSVEAAVEARGHEAFHVAHRSLSSLAEQVDQLLLVYGLDGEDVDA